MSKKGSAIWKGGFKDGSGTISTETGSLKEAPYAVNSRFNDSPGTNPEELVAAAHAGCFSMAFSLMLDHAGLVADKIDTHAAVTLEEVGGGFEVTSSHLTVKAKIPGIDQAKFDEISNQAKEGCPISKLLNTKISMDATLEN